MNLKDIGKSELLDFIRERLSFRFNKDYLSDNSNYYSVSGTRPGLAINMSGYNVDGVIGSCSKYNNYLLSLFSDIGIYERVDCIYLDAYKGCVTINICYSFSDELIKIDCGGYTTSEIIYMAIKASCIDNPCNYRRRED